MKQRLGRFYRAGGGDVIQRIIYCRGAVSPAGEINKNDTTFNGAGVEELMAEKINEKLKNIELINNGDEIDLVEI